MKDNKQGFTLIELLAVIVILAIILAIAVPGVLGLIDNAKKNAFKSSVSMALEQGRLYQLTNTIGAGKTLTEIGLTTGSLNSGGIIKEENNILLTDVPAINNGKFCVVPGTSKNDLTNGAVAAVRIQVCKTNPSQGEVACNLCDVDITAPTNVLVIIGTVTSKSIEVIASGIDAESDITNYAFSKDNGSTWTSEQASNVYNFTGLISGTYQIKVRVYNSVNMSTDSSMVSQVTTAVNTPTYSIVPTSGWATSKTVTIDYQTTSYTKEYSIDGGSTWTASTAQTQEILFNAPGNVIARITDGTNTINATTYNVTQIDATAPTGVTATIGTVTSTSIVVIASGTDDETGIVNYAFSKDNGATWTTLQPSNNYTFTGLTSGTYQIRVRAYNGTNMTTDSSMVSQATTVVNTPTYAIVPTSGWATSKTVTIDYQTTNYTKQYSIDGGTTWTTSTGQTQAVIFNAAGNVIARITDGTNTINATTYNVTQIDALAPTITASDGGKTLNSVTVIAIASDSGSGLNSNSYQYSSDNGTTWTSPTNATSYTFTGLAQETIYNCKAKIVDNAGNIGTSSTVTITTLAQGMQIFTASGTWIKPTGVTNVDVTVVGGGGGGGNNCGGGGGGGYVTTTKNYSVTGNVTVTIGVGGGGGANGTASSFGALIANGGISGSANGGNGGNGGSGGGGGSGGSTAGQGGSGGYSGINGVGSIGGSGQGTSTIGVNSVLYAGGGGGSSGGGYWGAPGSGGGGWGYGESAVANTGGGGGGGSSGGYIGGNGGTGIVIVRWGYATPSTTTYYLSGTDNVNFAIVAKSNASSSLTKGASSLTAVVSGVNSTMEIASTIPITIDKKYIYIDWSVSMDNTSYPTWYFGINGIRNNGSVATKYINKGSSFVRTTERIDVTSLIGVSEYLKFELVEYANAGNLLTIYGIWSSDT